MIYSQHGLCTKMYCSFFFYANMCFFFLLSCLNFKFIFSPILCYQLVYFSTILLKSINKLFFLTAISCFPLALLISHKLFLTESLPKQTSRVRLEITSIPQKMSRIFETCKNWVFNTERDNTCYHVHVHSKTRTKDHSKRFTLHCWRWK